MAPRNAVLRGIIVDVYAPSLCAGLGREVLVGDEAGDVVEEGDALGGVLTDGKLVRALARSLDSFPAFLWVFPGSERGSSTYQQLVGCR